MIYPGCGLGYLHMTDRSRQAREISQYVHRLEEEGITRRYVNQTKNTLLRFREHCRALGVNATRNVEPNTVWEFLGRYDGMSSSHQRTTASILRTYLAAHDNPAMLRMKLRYRGYGRTRVDWLAPEEIERVFMTPMTPQQMLMIGAGLLQGMRRIEMLRMTVGDARGALKPGSIMRVRGKGMKEREIPVHPDFIPILSSYLLWRDPHNDTDLMLGIGRTTSEKMLAEFCSEFGRKFTFHTMRRSFGRSLWLRGVAIETIATMYGHTSIDMTRRYLGIALTDMQKALESYRVPKATELLTEPAC